MNNFFEKKDSKFTITVIDENDIKNICLNDFNKNVITFGRGNNNDIILNSMLVSVNHGFFELDFNGLKIVDNNSTNGIFVNNKKIGEQYLRDGDSIKIDNPIEPLKRGIIIIVTFGTEVDNWEQFDLSVKDRITIGRADDSDIVLNHVSTSLEHAFIVKTDRGFEINNFNNNNITMINGEILRGQVLLRERDVILIANAKIIYNKGRLLYQLYSKGVRLDAIDIVKTVKVKGQKRNISDHVNFSIKPGEFVSFVGGSGAGKSTFMNCISGFTKPTSGNVFVNGNDLFSNYQTLKNIIGYVPQQDIVHNDLTLIDMLKYAANLRMPDDATVEEKNKRIEEVLSIVELSHRKDVMIRSLSGGQRKRASIAVELIADPKLFFLDEPTSGLDPGTERSIMKTLRKMADKGKTIILVTHNTLNLHLCDKVVFFGSGGKLCFSGPPKEALKFFEVDDFVDIYTLLSFDTTKWCEKYKNSVYKEEVIPGEVHNDVQKIKNNKSFFKQLITLTMRYAHTIINNKQQLFLLFAQAPIISFLFSIVANDKLFEYYDDTKLVLFALSCATIWLGLLNSIQEICKERVILEKEYMANMKLSAYLGSKILVLMIITFLQNILFIGSFALLIDVPTVGVWSGWFVDTVLICFLSSFTASVIGLIVSSFAKNASIAMTVAPILLIFFMLFSGILFPLEGATEVISNFILSKWSIEGLGIINDLNSLYTAIQDIIPGYVRDTEAIFNYTVENFAQSVGVIIIMLLVFIGICYIVLEKQLESDK